MRHAILLPLLAGLAAPALQLSAQSTPANVIRVVPARTLPIDGVITIIFDRAVIDSISPGAGSGGRFFTIEPAVRGVAEWRDPITLRFRPEEPFEPGTRYTVRVRDADRPGRNARVAPFARELTVAAAELLTLEIPDQEFLPRDPRLLLLYDISPDPAAVERALRIEFDARCRGPRHHAIRVVGERPVREDDPGSFPWYGRGERFGTDLRRVVEVVPDSLLPRGCHGVLIERYEHEDEADSTTFRIATRDSLRFLGATCLPWVAGSCPRGGLMVHFSTPVARDAVRRHLRIAPAVPFEVKQEPWRGDSVKTDWWVDTRLSPLSEYTVSIAAGLTDRYGQRIIGQLADTVVTDPLRDTLVVPGTDIYFALGVAPIVRVRSGSADSIPVALRHLDASGLLPWLAQRSAPPVSSPPSSTFRVPVLPPMPRDSAATLDVRIPQPRGTAGITLARVGDHDVRIHRTNLAVSARVGTYGGAVLVTGMPDLRPRSGAIVTILDSLGMELARARTGRDGVARVAIDAGRIDTSMVDRYFTGFHGWVHVELGDDRTLVALADSTPLGRPARRFDGRYPPPGNDWSVYRRGRDPQALLTAGVITDRGIYRPGDVLYVHGIVRAGVLGALTVPATSDSLRWSIRRQWQSFEPITRPITTSEFGTVVDSFRLSVALPLDEYIVAIERQSFGEWTSIGATRVRIAEYRPPAFLVHLEAPGRIAGGTDSLHAGVNARYLFDAPLSGARLRWSARAAPIHGSMLQIPGHEQYRFGHWSPRPMPRARMAILDSAVLDSEGEARISVPLDSLPGSWLARVWLNAAVTDAARQVISTSRETTIHVVSHHVGARTALWRVGRPSVTDIVVATPDGERVIDAPIDVLVTRPRQQDWTRTWSDTTPADTVGRCSLRSAASPVRCEVTPREAGTHELLLTSPDARGRLSTTRLTVYAVGLTASLPGNPHALEVRAGRDEYEPSDTVEIAFTSPFPRATAWITVERETVLASATREVGAGQITHRLVVPSSWAPNAFISVMLVAPVPREAVAAHARPLVVSGHTDVKISPTGQRLRVAVEPRAGRADAGDTVRIDARVTDASGRGVPSAVAVWAVDEGVLALTGYDTPDPIAGLYRGRPRGLRDASTLALIAREPPPLDMIGTMQSLIQLRLGRAAAAAGFLRSEVATEPVALQELRVDMLSDSIAIEPRADFRTTAFFIGNARTDADGRVTVAAKLPDNLTTFRVMAVAVAAGDSYGSGSSSFTVTRPLIARAALPRFVRPGDTFVAGAVVHREDPAPSTVRLEVLASGEGLRLTGPNVRELIVRDGIGTEGRFGFRVADRDSAGRRRMGGESMLVRLGVDDGTRRDVVDTRLDVRPDFRPRWHTRTGVVRDTATIELVLPPETDPARSRLVIAAASSPVALIRRANAWFDVYPYACTEQLVSAGIAMVSLARAQRAAGEPVTLDVPRLQRVVDLVLRRQNESGAFGYWHRDDWSSNWLTAYAGLFLLDARELGAAVNAGTFVAAARFLERQFDDDVDEAPAEAWWLVDPRARMSDRVAAVDFLARHDSVSRDHVRQLMELTGRMAWEDRVRLAEVLWRVDGDGDRAAATRLLREAWSVATIRGNRVSLPDTLARGTLFFSRIRPAARLLTATSAIMPQDARLGPLAELLVTHGRADERWVWSTQDWSSAAVALARFAGSQRTARAAGVRILAGNRELARLDQGSDSLAVSLEPVVMRGGTGERDSVRVRFQVRGTGQPVFFHASVEEIPRERPVRPDHSGIIVERWYERATDGAPVTEIAEGELVRVRLRVTVPSDRFFVIVEDALPAGLEVVDLGLRTSAGIAQLDAMSRVDADAAVEDVDAVSPWGQRWVYGSWWSPWDHREYRDDRVILSARMLWRGTYSATYLARATTAGTFVRPPAHAEEMYNPGVHGRSDGGTFVVRESGR